ncbi:MAG: septation protein SpoVG family protein [Candidatus Magasanikbacteria bacterium]|jgi:stage V sporulation protein G|nr:septation protein SpoVG family protein [Candidatus Magasanikbacteria bacterium]
MKITEVQIIPIKANNGLIAFGSVLFDDCLFLGSIGIHKKLDGSGYRITYPTKKIGEKDINIFHPINKEVSKLIEDEIIKKVNRLFA